MNQNTLVRSLGLREALAVVIGTVIGTGIFLKPAIMSHQVGSPLWVLLAFAAAGLLSFCGALCYAELGSLFPRAGGEYVYLREAYGSPLAFLYGWMRFWIGSPGSIAAYAVGATTFLNGVFPLGGGLANVVVAVSLVWVFSLMNCLSVAIGGKFQAFLTLLKLVMIIGLALSLFLFASTGSWGHLSEVETQFRGWSAFGLAMIAALWAYDGWNNMPMVAGEIKDPHHNIPRALGFGMIGIFLIYLLANLSYFYALPFSQVLSANSSYNPEALPVATQAAQSVFGPVAIGVLSIAFVVSALGAMNGSILSGSRIPFAMARDRLFFKGLGILSEKHRVPFISILIQAVVASLLAMTGTFDQLTDYVVFTAWIFYALVTAGVIILRRQRPQAERSYKVPLYPWLPIVFIICSVLLLINTLINSPLESGIGLVFILSGIPVYLIFAKKIRNSDLP